MSKFLIVLLCSGVQFVAAQSFDGIINAFRSGNAQGLAANFEANVDITIKNTGNSYSKNQAEMLMRNFFSNNAPRSFNVVHQGTSPEGSRYFIANYSTGSGALRVYVHAKAISGKLQIQEIRIEEN